MKAVNRCGLHELDGVSWHTGAKLASKATSLHISEFRAHTHTHTAGRS